MSRVLRLSCTFVLAFVAAFSCVGASAPKSEPAKETLAPSSSERLRSLPWATRRKLDPTLLRQLLDAEARDGEQHRGASDATTFLVYLSEHPSLAHASEIPDLGARRSAVVSSLQETAVKSQAGVAALLDQRVSAGQVAGYRSYWVFNGVAVDGDLETAIALAGLPEVASIRPNRAHRLPAPDMDEASFAASSDVEWNVAKIGADRVWETLGITGKGVVVASLDSGVDWTHPALRQKYRGYSADNPAASTHDYNWFDPTRTYPLAPGPNHAHISNQSDHGTHTMGTILGSEPNGSNAIGVAPGATWIAAKVFDDRGGSTDEWLHAGFQWCLAPTDLNGQNPDPSKAPHIVNNSWGDDDGALEVFLPDLEAWRAAGILSTWASGNDGPALGTIGAPASYGVAFSVGSVDDDDGVSSFSSRGPSPWGALKPEVVAPGRGIRSSIAGGDYEGGWKGTSMATPHVTGLMALLLEASEHGLTISDIERLIISSAIDLGALGPDNTYGYGRIDAFEAAASVSGGTFAGAVRDAETGLGLQGASIVIES